MKAVEIKHCQVGATTSRADGSVKVSFITPELRPSEAGALLTLHGKNCCISIVPEDVVPEEVVKVDTARGEKTPSQRFRAVLFLLWRQEGEQDTFDNYYVRHLNRLTESVKAKLQ